jgi:two-component system sensor histidine kinase UhpB
MPTRTAREAGRGGAQMRAALLGLPLDRKLALANAGLALLVSLSAVAWVLAFGRPDSGRGLVELMMAVGVGAVLASVAVSTMIFRLALVPLRRLERAAEAVRAGDLDARADLSDLADPDMARLITTFNRMLDDAGRQRLRLRRLTARAVASGEEERRRIALELHDGMAQSLTASRLRLRVARTSPDRVIREEQLEVVARDLGQAVDELRRMATGLRPPALDLGLVPAIEHQAGRLADTSGIDIRVHADAVDDRLVPDTRLALYRIAQEALANVVLHSGAGAASVRVERVRDGMRVIISDDGCGFRPAKSLRDGEAALGLLAMQERARQAGGSLHIASELGRGTTVTAILPTFD